MNVLEVIPVKSSDIEILPYDGGGHLIVQKELNYHVKVNQLVVNLLNLIDGKKTIKELAENFNKVFKKEISPENIYEILFQTLGKYHIIKNDLHEYKALGKPDYLKLSFTILNKDRVAPFANFFAPLFSYKIFYPLLIFSFLIIASIGIVEYDYFIHNIYNNPKAINPLFIALAMTFVIFLHEFGHAAACKKYGGNIGEIGFGFYLLTPVMYADVSNAWKLKKSERIVVNLGGFFMQMLVATLFGLAFFITKKIEFLGLVYMIGIISVMINLNPFFRTDGYWVLSDVTGVSNLRKNSTKKLMELLNKIIGKGNFLFTKKNVLLALYALISSTIIVLFLGWIFITDSRSIINLPYNLYLVIREMFTDGFSLEKYRRLFFPILFYVFLFRLLRNLYKRNSLGIDKNKRVEILWISVNILLSLVYLLSAVGKTMEFTSFVEKINQYPLSFTFLPHIILGVEYFLALSFGIWSFRKITPKLSMLFLVIITLTYVYGYVYLGIKDCDCFGEISLLNSNDLITVLAKNILLILASLYLVKSYLPAIKFKFPKILLSVGIVALFSFQTIKYNASKSGEYVYESIGHSIFEYPINISKKMKSSKYWFIFSPTCPHCKEAIPLVNSMAKEKENIIGITMSGKEEELKQLMQEVPINFSIEKINREKLKKITKTVPVVLEINNDTIKKVYNKTSLKQIK